MGTDAIAEACNKTTKEQEIRSGSALFLELTGWKIGGAIRLYSGEDIVLEFKFEEVNGERRIARKSTIDGTDSLVEAWGGWPLGASSSAVSIEFTLTETAWQIKVNQKRHPWLDFHFRRERTVSKWEIECLAESGSTVKPKVCEVQCASGDECRCGGEKCYSKPSPSHSNTSGCTADSSGAYCCEGTKKEVATLNTLSAGDVVSMVELAKDRENQPVDPDYMQRACESILAGDACSDLDPERFPTKKRKLQVVDKEMREDGPTGRMLVYIPAKGTTMHVSPWALVRAEANTQVVNFDSGPLDMTIDLGLNEIKIVAHTLPLEWGTYITRINKDYQFTLSRMRSVLQGGNQFSLTTSDVPELTVDLGCNSDYDWVDKEGTKCQGYSNWCTKQGFTTDNWRRDVCPGSSDCGFETRKSDDDRTALDACCICGGGSFAPRSSRPSPGPSPPPELNCPECFGEEDGSKLGISMTFTVQNGDYAKLESNVDLRNQLMNNVKTLVMATVTDGHLAAQDGTFIIVERGSIIIRVTCFPDEESKIDILLSSLKAQAATLESGIVEELKKGEYSGVLSGGDPTVVRSEPKEYELKSRKPQGSLSWFDRLFQSEFMPFMVGGGIAALASMICCFVLGGRRSSAAADIGNRELALPQSGPSAAATSQSEDRRSAPARQDKRDQYAGDYDYEQEDRERYQRMIAPYDESHGADDYDHGDDRDYGDDRGQNKSARSDRQERSMSRARSDVSNTSMGDGESKSLAAPQRGRRHHPSPRRNR